MEQVTITGNIGKVDSRESNGKTYISISVAVNKKTGGEEITNWYNCITTNEKLLPSLVKGTKMLMQGDLEVKPYLAKNGEPKVERTIWVRTLEFLSPKKEGNGSEMPAETPVAEDDI